MGFPFLGWNAQHSWDLELSLTYNQQIWKDSDFYTSLTLCKLWVWKMMKFTLWSSWCKTWTRLHRFQNGRVNLPYCFGTYAVLFESYTKNFRVWISSFFKAYEIHTLSKTWTRLHRLQNSRINLPYCFGTYVVLFKSYTKNFRVWISSFFKAHTPCLQCLCIIYFHLNFGQLNFKKCWWGTMLFKPCLCAVYASFRIQQPKIHENVISFLMPCLISVILLTLISDIFIQTLVYGLLQKYLWKHVNQLCLHSPSDHVVQNIEVLWVPICRHMQAYGHPDSGCVRFLLFHFSSKSNWNKIQCEIRDQGRGI